MYQRILVATDGSALSKKAVKHAIALAASTGAALVALKIVPRYPMSFFEGSATVTIDSIKAAESKWAEEAGAQLDSIVAEAAAAGVKAKSTVVKSDLIAESIIAAAKKHKADIVVMASHGRKGIKRILLGSEALAGLTHSEVPVLILR